MRLPYGAERTDIAEQSELLMTIGGRADLLPAQWELAKDYAVVKGLITNEDPRGDRIFGFLGNNTNGKIAYLSLLRQGYAGPFRRFYPTRTPGGDRIAIDPHTARIFRTNGLAAELRKISNSDHVATHDEHRAAIDEVIAAVEAPTAMASRTAAAYAARCRRFHHEHGKTEVPMTTLVPKGSLSLEGGEPTARNHHLMFLREADIALLMVVREDRKFGRRSEIPDVFTGRWGPLTPARKLASTFGSLIQHALRRMDDTMSHERAERRGFGKPFILWLVQNKIIPLLLHSTTAPHRYLPGFHNFGGPDRPNLHLLSCGIGLSWPHQRALVENMLASALHSHMKSRMHCATTDFSPLTPSDIMRTDPFSNSASTDPVVPFCAAAHPYWKCEDAGEEYFAWYKDQRWLGGCWVPEMNSRVAAQWSICMRAIHAKEIHPEEHKVDCVPSTTAKITDACGRSDRTAYALAYAICFARCAVDDRKGPSMMDAVHGDYVNILAAVEANADVADHVRRMMPPTATDAVICGSMYIALRCAKQSNLRETGDSEAKEPGCLLDFELPQRVRTATDVAHPAQSVRQAMDHVLTPFRSYSTALADAMCVVRCVPRYRLCVPWTGADGYLIPHRKWPDHLKPMQESMIIIARVCAENKAHRRGVCHWMAYRTDVYPPGSPSPSALHSIRCEEIGDAEAVQREELRWSIGQQVLGVLLTHRSHTDGEQNIEADRMLREFLEDVESECCALGRYFASANKLSPCATARPENGEAALAAHAEKAASAIATIWTVHKLRDSRKLDKPEELITAFSAMEVEVQQFLSQARR